ncbi:hypothetical protein BS50DRAFT_601668 [Corynespora cassiicola Philippines]|uniref:DUF7492 domain-containing protein n=1 Tax=Corynespora cassiicola Philippines TaxID=1448308 RepID=A0A2T2NIE8_CORCC|nr:hypothetical protein BS50DRAFT_601668 [Corynespora cassiicola Philippines]
MLKLLAVTLAVLGSTPMASAHTWIEQLRTVNKQGDYFGEYGYARGMVDKASAEFKEIEAGFNSGTGPPPMNWEMPAFEKTGPFITANTTLCHPKQRKQEQSADRFPRLRAMPGTMMAMRYTENGHVTLPENQKGKPEKAGTVFVYGTTEPKEDEKLTTVLQWTQDGQGGDKRGKLIATNDYDDGRCYEVNNSERSLQRQQANPNAIKGQPFPEVGQNSTVPLACETNAILPEDAQTGKLYTIYWVWQWNTKPGVDPGLPKGKDEYYSTCIDIDVSDTSTTGLEASLALGQQDAFERAVKDFGSRTALYTDPKDAAVGPIVPGQESPSPTPGAPPTQPSASAVPSSQPSAPSGPPVQPSASAIPSSQPSAPALPSAQPSAPGSPSIQPSAPGSPSIQPSAPGSPSIQPSAPGSPSIQPSAPVAPSVSGGPPANSVPTAVPTSAGAVARHLNGAKFRGRSFNA